MTDWISLAVYVAGFVFTYRRAYLVIAEEDERFHEGLRHVKRHKSDRAGDAAFAMVAALFWPGVLIGYALYRSLTPKTAGERKADLDEREERIRQMERDLGIGR